MLALALGRAATMARIPAGLPGRHPRQRPHQPRRDRQDVPARGGAAGPGRDRQGERARARPAGPRHGLLRHRAGALHDLRHPRGAALPPGGPALALGRGGGPGGGQERHLAGPHPPGRGAAAPPVRAGGAPGGDARHQGRVVPASGGWSAWTGPASTSPTRRRTTPPSGGRGPAAARAPSRRSASWRWSRTARTCCSAPAWAASPRARRRWPTACCRRCGPGMLCLADRQFFGHALWREAAATGADLLWRVKRNLRLPREARLADGSYLSTIYPGEKDRRHRTAGVRVRVVEYRLEGVAEAEPLYRLVTTILDPAAAPAAELAALYHERWEIEGALAELKTHLRGARMVLRSKTPELGPAGVLGPAAGALRGARADARGGAAGRRGPGPALVPARRTGGAAQAAPVRRASPLGPGPPCMRRCWPRSWRSGSRAAEAGGCRAGSSAR